MLSAIVLNVDFESHSRERKGQSEVGKGRDGGWVGVEYQKKECIVIIMRPVKWFIDVKVKCLHCAKSFL